MNEQVNIRNVYLADIHLIRSIYRSNKTDVIASEDNVIRINDSAKPLTEDFGLPLALADYNKEVIGYAFVAFNSLNQPEIYQHIKRGYKKEETKQQLDEYAKRVLLNMYKADTQDYSRLDTYIKKLIDWLNRCH